MYVNSHSKARQSPLLEVFRRSKGIIKIKKRFGMSVGFLLKNIRFTLNFLYCLAVVKLYFDLALKDIDELGFFFFFS